MRGKGWYRDNYRHSLAARGIKTRHNFLSKSQVAEIERLAEDSRRASLSKDVARKYTEFELKLPEDIKKAQEVRRVAASGGTTIKTHFKEGKWSPEREPVHSAIKGQYGVVLPSSERPKIILTAGLPGSGKSTLLREIFMETEYPNILVDKYGEFYYVVDPDQMKSMMPEYAGGIGSPILHEESSYLKKDVLADLKKRKVNVILDTTFRNKDSTLGILNEFKDAGYSPGVIYVAVSPEQSIERASVRFEEEGRFVPLEMIPDAYFSSPAFHEVEDAFDRHLFVLHDEYGRPEILSQKGSFAKKRG